MRALLTFCAAVCTAIVLSEALGAMVLWSRGNLTPQTVHDAYAVLTQQAEEQKKQVQAEKVALPSMQEVSLMRVSRIMELNSRESELARIEQFLREKKNELSQQLADFERQQSEFQAELNALIEKINAESTKRTRNVLVSLPPADAVDNLMNMTLDENVTLIQGMQNKVIAKIMMEFNNGDTKKKDRGKDILKALLDGKPNRELANEALAESIPKKTAPKPPTIESAAPPLEK
ncbi:MAG: hypothetical protein ACKVT0_09630 [Planctomycetaceae bacterium]